MMDRKKVLIITGTTFRNDTNNGKTLNSLFANFNKSELAQIYFSPEVPNCDSCSSYYRINEKQLIKSFFGLLPKKCGGEISVDINNKKIDRYNANIVFNKSKTFVLLLREILWDISHWKNRNLKQWLDKVNPTTIFAFFPGNKKTAKFIRWVAERYNCKLVMFVTDDHYNDSTINPSYIRKLRYKRMQKEIDKLPKYSDIIIGCSELTAKEYGEKFNLAYEAIYTPADKCFLEMPLKVHNNKPVILRYFGNVELERWKVLHELGNTIKNYNGNTQKAKLEVYTSIANDEIINALNIEGACEFKGFVTGDEFYQLFQDADIAVHIESFSPRMMRYTRLSISTKIADYLGGGKCILAIGDKTLASIAHITPVSMTVNNLEDLPNAIEKLVSNPEFRQNLQEKARELCDKDHNAEIICSRMRSILLGEIK
ncbi:MAG: glycosyltransferase family 4 protein [Clostridiales bacterium]|nr:glycosyltransferase family 4 protein [Clostridiales bacterium]